MDRAQALYDQHGEKLRYLVVGAGNTAIGYGIFMVLLRAMGAPLQALGESSSALLSAVGHNYYLIVQWAGWFLAVPISTTSMKYLAFRSGGKLLPQIGRAYFIYLPAQLISMVLLWLTVKVLHLSVPIGQLVTIAVTTVFSYVGHKYFTFKTPLEVGEVPPQEMVERP